ncbi:transposase [bacterium]|nr:transposase [bacterium]
MPPDLRQWIPANHLAHFIVDAVDSLPLTNLQVNERGTGDEQYPPRMMLSVLSYCYATGTFSSRAIEQATHTDVAVRFLSGDTHPDHDTICSFRRENKQLLAATLGQVLAMARELHLLKVGNITVATDGTKILANASKHAAVSYQRAGEQIEWIPARFDPAGHDRRSRDQRLARVGAGIPADQARGLLSGQGSGIRLTSGEGPAVQIPSGVLTIRTFPVRLSGCVPLGSGQPSACDDLEGTTGGPGARPGGGGDRHLRNPDRAPQAGQDR